MDAEKIKHHIKHLQEEHDELEHQLKEQQKHYGEDRLVTVIKKKKLKLKDEIAAFKTKLL
jgi:uncharacterized protein YdcH (DUF465 family)